MAEVGRSTPAAGEPGQFHGWWWLGSPTGVGKRDGDDGRRGCRPWSDSLAELVSGCGEGEQVAGVFAIRGQSSFRRFESPFPGHLILTRLAGCPFLFEPLLVDLIENIPHGNARVEDGLPQRRHAPGLQVLRIAERERVSMGRDRPEQRA
jgi:hypothetical protein